MNKHNIKIGSNKSFGIVFFIFFLLISIYPLLDGGVLKVWSLVISIVFLILGILNSKILTPLNNLWFKLGILLGKIVSPLVMAFVFFAVVTPISLIMKVLKKDLLNTKKNKNASYWIVKSGPKSKMKNQF